MRSWDGNSVKPYLSAMTTSWSLNNFTTFFMKIGAGFLARTSSLCVWPKPNKWDSAMATDVLPIQNSTEYLAKEVEMLTASRNGHWYNNSFAIFANVGRRCHYFIVVSHCR